MTPVSGAGVPPTQATGHATSPPQNSAVGQAAGGLIRVSAVHRGRGQPIAGGDITAWLLGEGRRIPDRSAFFDELCWRILGTGIPLARASLHIRTLHPQFRGVGYRWWRERGVVEELATRHGIEQASAYLDSPVRQVMERGETARFRPQAAAGHPFAILEELAAAGFTDYLVLPVTFTTGAHHAISFATDHPAGFSDSDERALHDLLAPLQAILEIHTTREIAINILDTYIGRQAGRQVLEGAIQRGNGERIEAVILAADLRNFTRLSNELPGETIIALLNDVFERLIGPIREHGGEVLKFLGDGLLAIFSIEACGDPKRACACAIEAALAGLAALEVLNTRRVATGEEPLTLGIALHLGTVFYGNVGATDRLDFTAIGPAVNLASRLEGLTKRLSCNIVMSKQFLEAYGGALVPLGLHALAGIRDPVEVFAPEMVAAAKPITE